MEPYETLSIPTYVSLCSGYDGIGLGLKRVIPNLQTIAHCEIEAYAIAGLISKMEAGQLDACPVFSDISDFPFEDLRGQIGILSAGFPCQPFSSAGRRQSTEDPRHIYPRIADGISVCLPQYVFLENVRGIVSAKTADGESVLKYVLGDLESRGYRTEWGLFSAEETGAPHQRIRCFILAYRNIEGLEGFNGERTSKQTKGVQADPRAKGGTLGNPASLRPHRGSENCEGEQSEVLGERLESDAELANSNCDEQTKERGDNGEVLEVSQVEGQELSPTLLGGESTQGGELADPASREPRQSQARNGRKDTSGGSAEKCDGDLYCKSCGLLVFGGCGCSHGEMQCGECGEWTYPFYYELPEDGCQYCGSDYWPARPGEEQYEWEEPRVTEAQSELGGTVDGSARGVDAITNRVDRLRLLGNGVCPQTAELAWRTLWKELNDE